MNKRGFLTAGALALFMAMGGKAPRAVAQSSQSGPGPCSNSRQLAGSGRLHTTLYNGRVRQNAQVTPQWERRPEGTGAFFVIYRNPGTEQVGLEFRHPARSRLLNGHYRWIHGINSHRPHLKIGESERLIAPDMVVPKDGSPIFTVRADFWYEGSDLEGLPDEAFSFDERAFSEANQWAQAEAALIRRNANAGQCDQSRLPSCFLTSAAVGMLGRPDDCWELQALRSFRDGWLVRQPGGAEEIAEYYRTAPAIAARLESDPRRLSQLYLTAILPAALAARLGQNWLARALYSPMFRRLAELDC